MCDLVDYRTDYIQVRKKVNSLFLVSVKKVSYEESGQQNQNWSKDDQTVESCECDIWTHLCIPLIAYIVRICDIDKKVNS